jgi:UDP-glucose 4-epimerase
MTQKRGYLNNMKLLITGSNGFIGKHLKEQLKGKHKLTFCDTSTGGDIFSDNFEYDVKRVDAVFHLAAKVSVPDSFKQPAEYAHTNIIGTTRVVRLCQKYKKKLIYPSTAAVLQPDSSPYAKTKYYAEGVVEAMSSEFPAVILRLFNVYGENPNPGTAMWNFLNLPVTVYGNGATRDFINVKDVVAIMENALQKKWNGKIVEIGMGHEVLVNYIAELFAFYRGVPIRQAAPRPEIKHSVADTTMLKALYKKKLVTNIEKDILAMCNNKI